MAKNVITLYDAGSNCDLAWNPFAWKARYCLNFKGVAHKTTYLEYPDIEATMKRIGAPPTTALADGTPLYTVPVIVDESVRTADGGPTVIAESFEIAQFLDKHYPTPNQLIPPGTVALQMLFQEEITNHLYWNALTNVFSPIVPSILNEPSRVYWHASREKSFGKKLDVLCPKGSEAWEKQFANAKNALDKFAALLDKNGPEGNILVAGNQVTFSDFTILTLLDTVALVTPEEWEKIKTWHGGRWEKLKEHCAKWKVVH
ncbi:hypothetical protein K439DRAFT_1417308 [Ramaria rubella]|nr:hypothetical protein K439DRAFT_1417308 [Ramaria rubella]